MHTSSADWVGTILITLYILSDLILEKPSFIPTLKNEKAEAE